MPYTLGIDLGTTYSAAAVMTGGRAEIFTLGTVAPAIPSVVVLREDGEVLVGEAAERRSIVEPTRTGREFKRRLGDPAPLVLGGTPYGAEALMARLLRHIVDEVTKRQGGPPERIVITHPANYGAYKKDLLREMARLADVGDVEFITEPEAAAINYSRQNRLEPGEIVAVYDFGGGTFDAAVLRRTEDGFEVLGQPEGMERLGGIDFDQAILAHVDDAVDGQISEADGSDPMTRAALARLRADVRAAKESLSADTDVTIPVMLPTLQTEVRLTRPEFEAMIRPRILETVSALERAVRSSGVQLDDVARILLVGGSSRIPLVAEIVQHSTGRPVAVDAHPKFAIALGAAAAGAGVPGPTDAAGAPGAVADPAADATAPLPTATAVAGSPAAPQPATSPVHVGEPSPARDAPPRRRGGVPLVAMGLAVLLLAGGAVAAFALLGGNDESGTGSAPTVSATNPGPATTSPPASGDAFESLGPSASATAAGSPAEAGAGVLTTYVGPQGGDETGNSGDGGPARGALLWTVGDLAVAEDGTLYIVDRDNENVRVVSPDGTISTLYEDAADGLWSPSGIDVDGEGNVYVADTFYDRIMRIAPDGSISQVAGTQDVQSFGGDGGPATAASLATPYDVAVESDGTLYIADTGNNRIRRVDPSGTITTFAGTGSPGFGGDGGPAEAAELSEPLSVAVDDDGNVYVADTGNHRVRRIDTSGTITTIGGNGGESEDVPIVSGPAASEATLPRVTEVSLDDEGNVYASTSRVVVRITQDGSFTVVAGGGATDEENVPATDVYLVDIAGLAVDSGSDTLYVADRAPRVRAIALAAD